jgi:muconolactone delta-isomerase
MREILKTLPLADWLTTETVPLTRHPSDPAVEVRAS